MTEPTNPLPGLTPHPTVAGGRGDEAVSFDGRTPRKAESLRLGVAVGIGLLVALGAAVTMGASPAPSAAGSAGSPALGGTPVLPGEAGPWFGHGVGSADGRGPGHGQGHDRHEVSVTAIAGSSVSLATDDGWTRTITVTDATTISRGGEPAALDDLAVGDSIRFRQTRNDDGTYRIDAIAIVLPSAAGTVSAVDADSITIARRDGTSQTIATTAATTYHVGSENGTRADVVVGATILATGDEAADGTLTATSVQVRVPHVLGTISALTADTLTLTRRDGTTVTVHIGSDTAIRVAGVPAATLADIETGMVVAVAGTERADGSLDAQEIAAGRFMKGRGHGPFGPGDPIGPDDSAAPDAPAGSDG